MSTSYLDFIVSHPYSWGIMATAACALGLALALPRLRIIRPFRRPLPRRRIVAALYLWAIAVCCATAVFFVPLRERAFTQTAVIFHGSLFVALMILIVLRRLGLFIGFALILGLAAVVPIIHLQWTPLRTPVEAAEIRVVSASESQIILEFDLYGRSGGALGPGELSGSLMLVRSEILRLPDPLFFVGFDVGYRLREVTALEADGSPGDAWALPGADISMPGMAFFDSRVISSQAVDAGLLRTYIVVVDPEGPTIRLAEG